MWDLSLLEVMEKLRCQTPSVHLTLRATLPGTFFILSNEPLSTGVPILGESLSVKMSINVNKITDLQAFLGATCCELRDRPFSQHDAVT